MTALVTTMGRIFSVSHAAPLECRVFQTTLWQTRAQNCVLGDDDLADADFSVGIVLDAHYDADSWKVIPMLAHVVVITTQTEPL